MLDVVTGAGLDFARMNAKRYAVVGAIGALALAARSDNAFCADVLGFVATG